MAVQTIRVGWHTEAGRRSSNQDAILVEPLPGGRQVYALADGMGGHRAGEVASRRALETLAASLRSGSRLRDAVEAANAAVYEAAAAEPAWEGMGTTLVALLRTDSQYEIVNVGDSRAYRIETAGVRQITADHSFEVEAVESGRLSAAEAARSPWRRALTRAIGTDRHLDVDLFGPFDAGEPHAVVMCSDGLYGSLSPDVLRRALNGTEDPGVVARNLVREAYRNGSADNISVAILVFGGGPLAVPDNDARTHPILATAPSRQDDRGGEPHTGNGGPEPNRASDHTTGSGAGMSVAAASDTADSRHMPFAAAESALPAAVSENLRSSRRRRLRRPNRLTKLEVTVILVLLGAVFALIAALATIT